MSYLEELFIQEAEAALSIRGLHPGSNSDSGGGNLLDLYIEGTMTEIESYAVNIGEGIFAETNITSASFPKVTTISDEAFAQCRKLTHVELPLVTEIGDYAFANCESLTNIDLPLVTEIGDGAFEQSGLESICLPKVTKIGESVFASCESLTNVDLPLVTEIGDGAFYSCGLESICLPKATTIGYSSFAYSSSLTYIDLPVVTEIDAYAFSNASNLACVALRNTNQICTLVNVSAFNSTMFKHGSGHILVPSALIEDYKAATNWSTYANTIYALEDYTIDGTVTGELDTNKV